MSGRQDQEVRQIHPKALATIGDEVCLEMLAVARDLRSGAIPPEQYDQTIVDLFGCETACCIAGHLRKRLSRKTYHAHVYHPWTILQNEGLLELFWSSRPSDPRLAADAIERFVFDGSDNPWEV